MKVLKFGAGLFENEQNLLRIKDVVEATEGRVVVVTPEGRVNALRDMIPGSQVVPPQICLAGNPEILTPHSRIVLVPGIIPDGLAVSELTDLEVGAPDYLASLIAASNEAESLEIWTDQDGFMTADPSSVKTAYLIKEMSYREAMELCNFGVGLIYSPALFPVNSKGIPTVVSNLLNPDSPGTTIRKECPSGEQVIRGISSIDNVSLITLSGTSMAGVVGVNCRIFTALALERISAFLVCQSASETGISIGVSAKDAPRAKAVLDGNFAREIANGSLLPMKVKDGLAAVSVIGDNMRNTPGTAGKLFATLGRNGISVSAFAQDASESNISFIVDRAQLRKSLNVIHDSFFLSEYQELNLFLCGIGTVGSRLIAQIKGQRQKLMDEHNLKINVVGIARSVKAVFDRDGIDLPNWKERLENGIPITPAKLRDEVIGMNIFNSVFVDCTASADIASLYEDFLNRGISVVAANKIAASSDYSNYKRLKEISHLRGVKFLFETNVGAGLPIIGTINDLRNSGDRILKMEAVVSGTLNFIFNNLSEVIPFSQAVKMAKEQGFSEPDPRMDLSGTDVIRKLVILSREAGYEVDMKDVQANLFIPPSFFECSLDEFWARLPELDAKFEADRKRLMEEGKRWRFVAVNDHGKCSVSLREIPLRHSFYVLDGSNNIILLTTERYNQHPMLIQGYGAGAEVT
ncbi:MAG: bifunctional aspartate kinase/homoserine dehydrogenase I, partial [Bacteroidales bacterium]|nr:bifunctional aspartate kinase/homoserine dehydrogenase I [Bacteroidales bacterium]